MLTTFQWHSLRLWIYEQPKLIRGMYWNYLSTIHQDQPIVKGTGLKAECRLKETKKLNSHVLFLTSFQNHLPQNKQSCFPGTLSGQERGRSKFSSKKNCRIRTKGIQFLRMEIKLGIIIAVNVLSPWSLPSTVLHILHLLTHPIPTLTL